MSTQGRVDGLQHFFLSERLEQVTHRARGERSRAHVLVRSMRGDEDHGQIRIRLGQLTLKLESIHPRHADVQDQAVRLASPAAR